jgi:endonuclease I
MKKFLSLVFSSTLFLVSCTSQVDLFDNFQNIDIQQQYNQVSSLNKKRTTIKNDWYERLSPELKKYYSRARGKTGEELFMTLHQITGENYKTLSYGEAKSFMYAVADNVQFNGKTGIFDAYSQVFIEGRGGNGDNYREKQDDNLDGVANDFINCEHTWPQSFFNKELPMLSDLHHLQSTLSVPNNRRGHYPFGVANPKDVVYTTIGGSKLSLTDKTNKARTLEEKRKILNLPYEQSSQIIDKEFDAIFEPGDKQKGNTARAMLYFYLRYYDRNIRQGEFKKDKFWDSKVSTLIKWATEVDPPDEQDKRRDDLIFQKQGNRNPFNDVPEFALLIGEDVFKRK